MYCNKLSSCVVGGKLVVLLATDEQERADKQVKWDDSG